MIELARFRIEAVVFICGALLMALEIMGGRLLTPYYGNTVYVWGSVIGIFLLSLSLGYYLGGKLADRKPSYSALAAVLMVVGLFIMAVPFVYKSVTELFNAFPRMFAPIFSVIALFLIPSLLLGMVSPFAIKLKARDIRKIGKLSGNLYALSTMGSVIGTFLATFVLILFFPTKTLFLCLGAVSLLVAATLSKKRLAMALLLLAIIVVLYSAAPSPTPVIALSNLSSNYSIIPLPGERAVFESLYGEISVEDTLAGTRTLSINGGEMSEMDMKNEDRVLPAWLYIDCMQIPFAINPEIKSVLNMGLGAGQYQRKIYRYYGVDSETVEINDKVLEAAQTYFNLTLTDRFRVYIDDARAYLQNTDKKYDLIAIDVFHFDPALGYEIPFHLATREFFELVKIHLNNGGVLVMNFATSPNSRFLQSEYKTIGSVFNSLYSFGCSTEIIVAYNEQRYSIPELKSRASFDPTLLDNNFNMTLRSDAILLTDDFFPLNPFEELGNKSV